MAAVASPSGDSGVALSVVVVGYNMARELPRTLRSLSTEYQRAIAADDYEVVVVDNGSHEPLDEAMLKEFPGRLRSHRLDPAPPSPARAANIGIEMADGALIGLLIDGARIASPGLLANARLAARLGERPVIATLAWHLGPVQHMRAHEIGYDQETEDALLDDIDWESDGYRLFDISTLAASSHRGWFGPLAESNALFLTREMWSELRGLDERFVIPGGGRANHDLYRRACALDGSQLILLLGEGTFHQTHGGAATSRQQRRAEADAEYEILRGQQYRPPAATPLYVGTVPARTLGHLEHSIRWAVEHGAQDSSPASSASASGERGPRDGSMA